MFSYIYLLYQLYLLLFYLWYYFGMICRIILVDQKILTWHGSPLSPMGAT